jgi:hypothetical protein
VSRPKVTATVLLEWALAAVAGLAMTRVFEGLAGIGPAVSWMDRALRDYPAFLTGVVAVEGLIVAVSAVRRTASTQGIGRWAWLATWLYLLLRTILALAWAGRTLVAGWRSGSIDGQVVAMDVATGLLSAWLFGLSGAFAVSLLAALLAARLARWPDRSPPDAREWSGRVFLAILIGAPAFEFARDVFFIAIGSPLD